MGVFTQVSAAAAGSLVAAVWEGLVLAACVALALRLLPGITAAARSVVWSAAMLGVVALPFVHFSGTGVGAATARVYLDERLSVGLVCVWAALSVWRGLELVRSAIWLRGISRRARPVEVEAGIAALLELCAGSKDKYGDSDLRYAQTRMTGSFVQLCTSDEVDRPSVVGFLRPRILVPAGLLARLSGAELEQIVLHEMEHLRRGDDWTNLLQKLSLVAFPLNPALVWIERRLCLERELACDDRVLRTTNARKAYAACLANLAEHSLVRRGVSLALGAWERQSELVRRVHRILTRPDREMGRGQAAATVCAMVAGLLAGVDGLAHSPLLVSFGPATHETVEARVLPLSVPSQMGQVTLTKAVVPVRRPMATNVLAVATHAHKRNTGALRSAQNNVIFPVNKPMVDAVERASNMGRAAIPDPEGTMVVLVTWRTVVLTDANATPATKFSQTTYAAVPTRNGWLFVQL